VDPNIRWEETTSQNIGIDFGINNGRLGGSVEFYRKYTDDLIAEVAAPAFTNLSDLIRTNIGEMANSGVELVLDYRVMDRKDWDWDLAYNISYNASEIKKLDNRTEIDNEEFLGYEIGDIAGDVGQTIQILRVGESNQAFLTYDHLTDASGKVLADGLDHNGDGFADDLDIYRDVNDDGIINEKDLLIQGSGLPDVITGLTSILDYKNFSLSATCRAHFGNQVYNNIASSSGYYDRLSDRKNSNIDISAFDNDFTQKQLKSNVYIENADFFKLDNISLSYTVPVKKFVETLSLQAAVTNVFTITGYSGLDPELPQFNRGIDENIYPISRNFLIGLNASF